MPDPINFYRPKNSDSKECIEAPKCTYPEYRPKTGSQKKHADGYILCIKPDDDAECQWKNKKFRPNEGFGNKHEKGYVMCEDIQDCPNPDKEYRPENGEKEANGLVKCVPKPSESCKEDEKWDDKTLKCVARCTTAGEKWNQDTQKCEAAAEDPCVKDTYYFDETWTTGDTAEEQDPYTCKQGNSC